MKWTESMPSHSGSPQRRRDLKREMRRTMRRLAKRYLDGAPTKIRHRGWWF